MICSYTFRDYCYRNLNLILKNKIDQRESPILVNYRQNDKNYPIDNWIRGPEGGGVIIGHFCHIIDLFNYLIDKDICSIIGSKINNKMKRCGIKTKQMSKPETLELGKIICDTSYLGWLINYSQISNMIAKSYGVNYDEMWEFSDEIHKFLGNRPKLYKRTRVRKCPTPLNSEKFELWST